MEWSQCPDVERIPGKVSGAWLVVGTRIPADAVIDNAEDGYSAEQKPAVGSSEAHPGLCSGSVSCATCCENIRIIIEAASTGSYTTIDIPRPPLRRRPPPDLSDL
jgi:hypothetical protein